MEKDKECYKCGIGFPQIGTITSEERIGEHETPPPPISFIVENVISFLLAAYIWSTTLNLIMMQSATIASPTVNKNVLRIMH